MSIKKEFMLECQLNETEKFTQLNVTTSVLYIRKSLTLVIVYIYCLIRNKKYLT